MFIWQLKNRKKKSNRRQKNTEKKPKLLWLIFWSACVRLQCSFINFTIKQRLTCVPFHVHSIGLFLSTMCVWLLCSVQPLFLILEKTCQDMQSAQLIVSFFLLFFWYLLCFLFNYIVSIFSVHFYPIRRVSTRPTLYVDWLVMHGCWCDDFQRGGHQVFLKQIVMNMPQLKTQINNVIQI